MSRKTTQGQRGVRRARRTRVPAIERALTETLRSLDDYVQRSDHARELDRDYEKALDRLHRKLTAT